MKVVNVHQRLLHASPERVGVLIDSLSSPGDALWPKGWPRMKMDRPLGAGAIGGHGPIRYFVESYTPGQSVRFQFTSPKGFDGWHGFEVLDATPNHCVLEHRIEMNATGRGIVTWLLAIRALHDMCVEEALSQGQVAVGNTPRAVAWTPYVRFLFWVASPRKSARRVRAG